MNTQTRQPAVLIAVAALAAMTLIITGGLVALVLVLHDGAATSAVVQTLVNMGVAGVVCMATLAGIHTALPNIMGGVVGQAVSAALAATTADATPADANPATVAPVPTTPADATAGAGS